mmetsp:Transcript_13630/g.27426  ORF Transcript_13630/g.27426 Transcript_13630/m.27426 type:complete len:83 (+) Transcript_13630:16-264(+)
MPRTVGSLFRFLELPAPDHTLTPLSPSYAAAHAASTNVSCCGGGRGPPEPMLPATRKLLSTFYQPHNQRLAKRVGDPSLAWT